MESAPYSGRPETPWLQRLRPRTSWNSRFGWVYRHGDRSAMIVPLAVNAMVLKLFGEAEAVATIRGRLPRRLTIFMIRELAEIDRWLAAELPPERRRELASIGAEKTPRELQALAREVAARHLELTG